VNPDCRDGKHAACSGSGWSNDFDTYTDCSCPCHREDLAA